MLRYAICGLFLNAMLLAAPVFAQEPQTEAGAQAAAIALLRTRPWIPDSTPIVTDSAAVRAHLVHCSEVTGSPPVCSMVYGKWVIMVITRLASPTTANVDVRYYYVLRGSCPLDRPFEVPIIAYTRTDFFSLRYVDGHWKDTGVGRSIEC
jgi:hypothetical protein